MLNQFFRFLFCLGLSIQSESVAAEIHFNRDIRPILSDKCISCHGPDETHREADLRLDLEESAEQDRGNYSVIVPGDVKNSELITRIFSDDPDLVMPPAQAHKELTAIEKDLLKEWIKQGAVWQPHWAYVPPQSVDLPVVNNEEWCENFIDRFILAELHNQNLEPSIDADPVTLIRRLSFDLTGLPPSPDTVEKYASHWNKQSIIELVDELLASPHYGERMAVYWLDLVRYADTVGYHGDQDHSISPYRDWVINAFNSNMPYDQMTKEQLAGDLLPEASIDQLIASGYNRLLQTSHEGGVQPKEYLAIYAADRVRNFSEVWMGATMGCAQCHTHKYDPYTITDFYSMVAFFADLDEAQHFKDGSNALPTRREPEIEVLPAELRSTYAALIQQRQQLQQQREEFLSRNKEQVQNEAQQEKTPHDQAIEGLEVQIQQIERQNAVR